MKSSLIKLTRSVRSTFFQARSVTSSDSPFGSGDGRRVKWFDKTAGLSFACTSCGKCCTGKTKVYLNEAELESLASHLQVSKFEFMRAYTKEIETSDGELFISLKSKEDKNECVLLDGKKCSVYEARPTQCRTFPFWPQILMGESEWKNESKRCEGINSTSALISSEDIMTNLIVHQVHAKGLGPNYVYDDAIEHLNDVKITDASALSGFEDDFFGSHHTEVVFENNFLRVVDITAPTPESAESDFQVEGEDEDQKLVTTRRLEFLGSPILSQTEVKLNADKSVDHDTLELDVHRFLAAVCVHRVKEIALGIASDMYFNPATNKVIHIAVIGAGGCALPSHLAANFRSNADLITSNLVIDVVEANPDVLKAAEDYFGANFTSNIVDDLSSKLSCTDRDDRTSKNVVMSKHLNDGVSYLRAKGSEKSSDFRNNNECKGYDILVVDAFEDVSARTVNESLGEGALGLQTGLETTVSIAPPVSIAANLSLLLSSLSERRRVVKRAVNSHEQPGGLLLMNLYGSDSYVEFIRQSLSEIAERYGCEEPVVTKPQGMELNHILFVQRLATGDLH